MVRSSGPRTARTMQNSEAPRRGRLLGRGQHLVGVEERRGLHRRVELGRLAAEVAVLGAAAGLGRQDALDLDLGPAPGQAHLVGQGGRATAPASAAGRPGGQLVGGELPPLVEQGGGGGRQARQARATIARSIA